MNIFKRIKYYFKYFTKYKLNIIIEAFKTQPYDYYYLLKLKKAKLQEMLYYFENSKISCDDPKVAKDIKLAIQLLNIIDETKNTFTYITPERNPKIISEEHSVLLPGAYYKCLVKVNLKNKMRFVKTDNDIYSFEQFPDILYITKAENLYYKLLKERLNTWYN